MVYKWHSRRCRFTIWSHSRARLDSQLKSHLLGHYTDSVSKQNFRLAWECPHCDIEGQTHDKETGVQEFKDHLYSHVEGRIQSGVHIADDIGGSGNVLVKAPIESTGAVNARAHFLSVGDIVVIVTNHPEARLRLLHEKLNQWPERTVVITTKRRPLEDPPDIDFSDVPVEVVKLDPTLGPTGLGETISRVIEEQHTPGKRIAFGFDILPEIIESFDVKRSYRFLSMLSARLKEVNALAQFYINPRPQSSSVLNAIDDEFDLELTAENAVFIAQT